MPINHPLSGPLDAYTYNLQLRFLTQEFAKAKDKDDAEMQRMLLSLAESVKRARDCICLGAHPEHNPP